MVTFPFDFKNKILFPGGGSFWLGLWVVLLSLYFSDSDPLKTWALCAVKLWLFFRAFQMTGCCRQHRYSWSSCFFVWDRYRWSLNRICRFIVYRIGCTRMFICSKLFFTFEIIVFIDCFITIWSGLRYVGRISGAVRLLPVLFAKFACSANSVGHGWLFIIFCCIFWNYEVSKHISNI